MMGIKFTKNQQAPCVGAYRLDQYSLSVLFLVTYFHQDFYTTTNSYDRAQNCSII